MLDFFRCDDVVFLFVIKVFSKIFIINWLARYIHGPRVCPMLNFSIGNSRCKVSVLSWAPIMKTDVVDAAIIEDALAL